MLGTIFSGGFGRLVSISGMQDVYTNNITLLLLFWPFMGFVVSKKYTENHQTYKVLFTFKE